ncbi:B3 domain-containing protein Os05g0481400-like isoform X2 [Magnolia sinica]|uniref:B3 domain-containing protein Os05g0481400-like isoform X2 n=1 Tax=Magnolia sinica TaxID=86752 RepID=UPI0026594B38|nr:B3 domain-containing protein Os05g0481400-like isoform X2 [Magnolia sinica]
MAKEDENAYEETRKKRLEDNLKRFQDLGILKISKSLSEVTNSGNKLVHRHEKPKSKASLETLELRRSSRGRNTVTSYREVGEDFRHFRHFCTSYGRRSSTVDHAARTASYEERVSATKSAEKLQSNLKPDHPSFVKSMVRSHVSSCFWLGLPHQFCKDHLPRNVLNMILEDENGSEYDTVYIGSRTGLSGGWKGFAMDHKLGDGDALVFELVEPTRFKVYIVKASESLNEDDDEKPIIKEAKRHEKPKSKASLETLELRRSSRERNTVTSYHEVGEYFQHFRTRKKNCNRKSFTVDHTIRIASYEERVSAMKSAEKLQSNLKSDHPSFVKSMVRSHVSSCFWLALPRRFCKDYLPRNELNMILEDENGSEYDAIYIGSRTGLSGGWRGFAVDHKLDDGDALVFELAEPTKFKVYMVKASESLKEDDSDEKPIIKEAKCSGKSKKNESLNEDDNDEKPIIKEARRTGKSKKNDKGDDNSDESAHKKLQLETESTKRAKRAAKRGKL